MHDSVKVLFMALRFLRRERKAVLPISTIAAGVALLFSSLILSSFLVAQAGFLAQTYLISPAELLSAARALAVISLLVGATETGVVMSRIVLSRIKVVGVMRASGIKHRFVFSLFIIEAGFYGLIGAAFGVCFGSLTVVIIGLNTVGFAGLASLFSQVLMPVLICVGIAVGVSLLAALYPCSKAIRIPIVRAIYHD